MVIQKFEDIIAWQKAQDFAVILYSVFRNVGDWGFKNQLYRAVVSISNNIAEGFDRCSDADFARFLYIATGSCSEVKSMLYLAERLGYINSEQKVIGIEQADEISRIIRGLIKTLTAKS
ncbi:MAG: four helix bundle protein [Prevotellaceae bacterium]|jgi:four helix bundle protein|nr:four helix bundle protein [Prevotellaceae bacterium]